MAEKKDSVSSERIYTVPLRKEWLKAPRAQRANRAVSTVRGFLSRHTKSGQVTLSEKVNETIWARGMHSPPGRIRVKAVMDKDGAVKAMLPEEKVQGPKDKKADKKEGPREDSKASEKAGSKEKPAPEKTEEKPKQEGQKAQKPKEK